jgi:hypothetical protein
MTPNQVRFVAAAFVAVLAVIGLIAMSGCSNESYVEFQSCRQARDAGAPLPLHQGDPGWNPKLDRDHDGAAC